jgi:hypothetical protein
LLGVIPLSSLVAIDEVDKIPPEEQARLLDILEEQRFTKDAYGYHFEVEAQTTIIGTGNPTNPKFLDPNKIETHELNILDTLRDRFTQVYIFRDDNNTEEKRSSFASKMNAIRKRPLPNYTFLRKFLVFASTIKAEYNLESEKMLNKFWAQQDAGGLMNNRFYNHIFKIAEAEAKLQLSEKIDEEIAMQTMESIQLMLLQYAEIVKVVAKPSKITLKKFIDILENTKVGVAVTELCKIASKEDPQISAYLGTNWALEKNGRLQQVVKSLRKHRCIRPIRSNPLVRQWFSDLSEFQPDESDGSDVTLEGMRSVDNTHTGQSYLEQSQNITSDSSDSPDSSRQSETEPKPRAQTTCPKCGEQAHTGLNIIIATFDSHHIMK